MARLLPRSHTSPTAQTLTADSGLARQLLCAPKPPPVLNVSAAQADRRHLMINSLSYMVSHCAFGYTPLPDYAATPADPSLRIADSTTSTANFTQHAKPIGSAGPSTQAPLPHDLPRDLPHDLPPS